MQKVILRIWVGPSLTFQNLLVSWRVLLFIGKC